MASHFESFGPISKVRHRLESAKTTTYDIWKKFWFPLKKFLDLVKSGDYDFHFFVWGKWLKRPFDKVPGVVWPKFFRICVLHQKILGTFLGANWDPNPPWARKTGNWYFWHISINIRVEETAEHTVGPHIKWLRGMVCEINHNSNMDPKGWLKPLPSCCNHVAESGILHISQPILGPMTQDTHFFRTSFYVLKDGKVVITNLTL